MTPSNYFVVEEEKEKVHSRRFLYKKKIKEKKNNNYKTNIERRRAYCLMAPGCYGQILRSVSSLAPLL
jgi:hypothetical protein